jgi:multicomponent K+:H+ antiporter subunit G
MTDAAQLPLWAAWVVIVLALAGASLSLVGAIGLLRFRRFYERVHAPTLGATLGMGLVVGASILFFSLLEGELVLRDGLIALFLTLTTPVTLILLARAAVFRDRTEGSEDVPADLHH